MAGAQSGHWTTHDVAESFALWWREAGLHSLASDAPHGWLDDGETMVLAEAVAAPAIALAPRLDDAPPVAPAQAPRGAMPGDLAAFLDWLARDPGQPEARWTGPAFPPPARAGAPLLILADMPDAGADDPALPFAPHAARFLAAMLGAIGLRLDQVGFAPLAMRRPPGGLLDDASHAALATRMRHYLGLAAPRAALILGDRTSRALVTPVGAPGAATLPDIRLDGATLIAAALPSADHLMRRPPAKAASWQALRLLAHAIAP
jgi:DNA polymerase